MKLRLTRLLKRISHATSLPWRILVSGCLVLLYLTPVRMLGWPWSIQLVGLFAFVLVPAALYGSVYGYVKRRSPHLWGFLGTMWVIILSIGARYCISGAWAFLPLSPEFVVLMCKLA